MLTFQKSFPENAGIPSGCIMNFIQRLKDREVPMHSFLLLRRDLLAAECYYSPCRADTLHRMFSISKSFTSIAVSLLADEGKLSLDDPIIRYFPDKLPKQVHPWIEAMTIRDMLMMRTCHASTTYKLDMTKDWVESFFTTPPTHPAGRIFHYDTSSAHTLCALAERLSQKPMLSYLKEKLRELDFSQESYMLTDPFGVSLGGSGLVATSMDLLKFGYLILRKGRINGRQLVSSSYLEDATANLTATTVTAPIASEACGYGYQFWQNQKGGCVCYGMGGQLIILLPEYDMICVTTADTQCISGGNQLIYDALYEEILPFVSDGPVPVNTGTHSLWNSFVSQLRMEPLKGALSSPVMERTNGVRFHLEENPAGFSRLCIRFSSNCASKKQPAVHADRLCAVASGPEPDTGTLAFTLKGKTYSFTFGLGRLTTGLFPLYDLNYAASGVFLDPDTLYIYVHIIDSYVGSVKFQLSFGADDVAVFMKKQEESLFGEFNGHLYGMRQETPTEFSPDKT